jgi:peptidoglycan/xylan/chitin deacetylase (PgdA/CDA1 family)
MKNNSIPVLYYHSVANHNKIRPWSFLTCDIKTFELQIRYLHKLGYTTCDWKELDLHMLGEKQLPKKCVHMQFDDGFLDNWTVVFPLMKELNFKFSIVVTPEFIEKHSPRAFSKDTNESNIKDWWGYLSEEELIEMEKSGLVDIQAHGYTHTWYETSDKIIDIYDGTQILPWLHWNNNLEEKAKWLTNGSLEKTSHGYPIFENEKSLSNLKAYDVNKEFIKESISIYNKNLSKEENLININKLKESYLDENKLGQYETEEDTQQRLKKELLGTREYLKNVLNKDINYLVWPGGGNSKMVQDLAYKYGFIVISKGDQLNSFNSQNRKISRVAAYHEFKPQVLNSYLNVLFIHLQILRANGNNLIDTLITSIKKIKRLIK